MKQVDKKKIIDAAFHIFVRDKIESAKMSEIAQAAGVGRATLFRHYPSKLELVIAVNAAKWKEYLDELDEKRPIASINEIPVQIAIQNGHLCHVRRSVCDIIGGQPKTN